MSDRSRDLQGSVYVRNDSNLQTSIWKSGFMNQACLKGIKYFVVFCFVLFFPPKLAQICIHIQICIVWLLW